MASDTVIAIKAPSGTTLEVPDPDDGMEYPQRRYQVERNTCLTFSAASNLWMTCKKLRRVTCFVMQRCLLPICCLLHRYSSKALQVLWKCFWYLQLTEIRRRVQRGPMQAREQSCTGALLGHNSSFLAVSIIDVRTFITLHCRANQAPLNVSDSNGQDLLDEESNSNACDNNRRRHVESQSGFPVRN